MRTSMPGLASWKAATRVTSHFAASEAVVLTVSRPSRSGRRSRRGCPAQILERSADRRQIGLRLPRQQQGSVAPHEQGDAELLLQPVDLMADRGLGDVQFGRGAREAQVARRRLEGTQSVQRGQAERHAARLA